MTGTGSCIVADGFTLLFCQTEYGTLVYVWCLVVHVGQRSLYGTFHWNEPFILVETPSVAPHACSSANIVLVRNALVQYVACPRPGLHNIVVVYNQLRVASVRHPSGD